VALLDKRKKARANRLSDRFEVRERPIQKDLVTVEKKGMGHGDSQGGTYAFQSQPVQAHREKVIAQSALNYIAEGLITLLGGESTSLSLARAVRGTLHYNKFHPGSIGIVQKELQDPADGR
jgi:DeoR/GlpR family transcriptional regulator of sugar metabolism